MSSELLVAVWGLGRHATRRVLPALLQSEGVKLAGICTRNEEAGRAKAAELNCHYFTSPGQMLSDERVQAVIVTTPTGLHFQHGSMVLEAEKHLWCEKPMTHSYASTCRLFELAAEKGVFAASCLMYKYHPQFGQAGNHQVRFD
jgi:predicted dehydrogenase